MTLQSIALMLFGGAVAPVNLDFEAKLVGAVVGRLSTGLMDAAAAG
jgi:hypothetical protein